MSGSVFRGIDIFDGQGEDQHCCWQVIPDGVDEEEARFISQRWLDYLSLYCTPPKSLQLTEASLPFASIIRIVVCGYLSKRGEMNPAYQKRWFVLTSDNKVCMWCVFKKIGNFLFFHHFILILYFL